MYIYWFSSESVTDADDDDDDNAGRHSTTIIDFPNLGLTYNGGWCSATKTR